MHINYHDCGVAGCDDDLGFWQDSVRDKEMQWGEFRSFVLQGFSDGINRPDNLREEPKLGKYRRRGLGKKEKEKRTWNKKSAWTSS